MKKTEVVNTRLTPELKAALKEEAERQGLSISAAIEKAISDFVLHGNRDREPIPEMYDTETIVNTEVIQKGCVCEGFKASDLIIRATKVENLLMVSLGWLWLKDKSPNGNKVSLKAIGEVPSDLTYKSLPDLYRQLTSGIDKAETPTEIVEAVLKVYEEEDHYQLDRMKANQPEAVERLEYLVSLPWFDIQWVTGHNHLETQVPDERVWTATEPRSLFLAPSLENLESRYQALARELSGLSTVCP